MRIYWEYKDGGGVPNKPGGRAGGKGPGKGKPARRLKKRKKTVLDEKRAGQPRRVERKRNGRGKKGAEEKVKK